MKALLWLLAVFAAAAALAVFARFDQGYVQIAWGQWRIEMSLLLACGLALAAFAALYALVRLARHTLALPAYVSAWRARRRRDRAHEALAAALQAWLEGRYVRAEKEASRAYEGGVADGSIEQSNATAVQSMSKLVTLSREFEMITKVIEAFSQVDKKAATDIASVR